MHSKRNALADYNTDKTKEKIRKFDLKLLIFMKNVKTL